jgi:hypothetical protein
MPSSSHPPFSAYLTSGGVSGIFTRLPRSGAIEGQTERIEFGFEAEDVETRFAVLPSAGAKPKPIQLLK